MDIPEQNTEKFLKFASLIAEISSLWGNRVEGYADDRSIFPEGASSWTITGEIT